MSKIIWWVIALAGLILIVLVVYTAVAPDPILLLPKKASDEPVATASNAAPPEPEVRYPINRPSDEKPLPALDTSDATLRNAINSLVLDRSLVELLQVRDFARHIVATVDNIPRQKIAQRLLPNKPAAGKFTVNGSGDALTIDPNNSARYAAYLRLLQAVDTGKAVALYVQYYPLFQQAYQDLGYPKGYFNDRLIEAIDNLLAAPEVKGPIPVIRPKVLFQYADPELEKLSAGQKIMIRSGSENEAQIKEKLREIRSELLRQVRAEARAPQKAH